MRSIDEPLLGSSGSFVTKESSMKISKKLLGTVVILAASSFIFYVIFDILAHGIKVS